MSSQETILVVLLEWCAVNEIWIDPRLQIHGFEEDSHEDGDAPKGLTVFSGDDYILPSTTLVKIPRDCVLSVRTCSLKDHTPFVPYGLGAQLALSFALYVEILKGKRSRWHGYIQSFPDGIVDLPLFWGLSSNSGATDADGARVPDVDDGNEALVWLRGTEAGSALQALTGNDSNRLDEIREYFEHTVDPLLLEQSGAWKVTGRVHATPCLDGFYRAFSLVSSRAFLVDAYHGLSMVPIADVFDHVVNNHVHLASDFNVCPDCGSLHECLHDREEVSVLIEGCLPEDINDQYFEMVSNAPIPPVHKIYNTYGETLTNAQLLNQYGFILDVNENDRLCWSPHTVMGILLPHESKPQRTEALNIWHTLSTGSAMIGQSGLVFENALEEPQACLNDEGEISFGLWTLLIIINLLANPKESVPLRSLSRDLLAKLVGLQEVLEAIDSEEADDDDLHALRDNPQHVQILLGVAKLVVDLMMLRKASSGKAGSTEVDLSNLLEGIPLHRRRTRLAVANLMAERSIIDACCARWATLMEVTLP